MNIDWEAAPEWAIGHGLIDSGCIKQVWFGEKAYMILGDSRSYVFGGGNDVTHHNHTLSQIQFQQLRPAAWSGEGLPPVGIELEAGFACEEFENWHKGICIAVGEDPEGREEFCVVKFGHKIAMYRAEGGRMRPIRTPEQVAADERLHEIRNALTTIKAGEQQFPNNIVRGNIVVATVEAMIDAGYRLQVTK